MVSAQVINVLSFFSFFLKTYFWLHYYWRQQYYFCCHKLRQYFLSWNGSWYKVSYIMDYIIFVANNLDQNVFLGGVIPISRIVVGRKISATCFLRTWSVLQFQHFSLDMLRHTPSLRALHVFTKITNWNTAVDHEWVI